MRASRRKGLVGSATREGLRAISFFAVALVCCVLVATAVNAALRALEPDKFVPAPKVLLDAAADPLTNVAFFGTSQVEHGVIPQEFDKAMDGLEVGKIHSYNVGNPAESVIEVISHIEMLYSLKNSSLRFIIYQPDISVPLVVRENNSMRAINYFTLWNAYRAIQLMNYPIRQLMTPTMTVNQYVGAVAHAVLRHYLNIGLAWAEPEAGRVFESAKSRGGNVSLAIPKYLI